MYKSIGVILVFVFLFAACDNSSKPEKPANLISKEKMSDILYDLYVINAAKGVNRKLLEKNGFIPETYILDKYNIDSLQFKESNRYHTFNSETYKDIVEKVKARLESEKSIHEEQLKEDAKKLKKKQDSINRVDKNKKRTKKSKDSIA
ncbi:DUF4296 domain-containing protein [Winogradskyella sp. UBA3174]|uniref:DUF4296 domain-containing protein n=1 Tax=Winogradskyella sp. UBA3174 TaxID=1947785 RepID=UPI0025E05244|nr:DUF4296 domain-containing protein [Winogradskyella sp. UBA3174]|tara:strand:- start:653 stop:1096 length:444 start_codon:yes stop_codon:yes gene_type:complete